MAATKEQYSKVVKIWILFSFSQTESWVRPKKLVLLAFFENIWSWYMQCFVLGHRLCDEPPPLENGYILGNHFREGKNITYKCNKGYWLRGSPVRICDGATGNWTVEAPICEGINQSSKKLYLQFNWVNWVINWVILNSMFFTLILQGQSLIHQRSSVTKPSTGRCWKVGCSLYPHCHLSGSSATEPRTMDGVPAHFTRSAMAWVPQWPLWGWESICSVDTLTKTGVSSGYKLPYHWLYRYIEAKKNISFQNNWFLEKAKEKQSESLIVSLSHVTWPSIRGLRRGLQKLRKYFWKEILDLIILKNALVSLLTMM